MKMKNILNISVLLSLLVLFSCEKDEDRAILKSPVTPNVMNALTSQSYVLQRDNAADVFEQFSWTNVDYGFDAATTYVLQVDLAANGFSSPIDVVAVTNKFQQAVTVGDFNKLLLDNNVQPDAATDLQFRIAAIINGNVDTVFSNVVAANVTPYATTFPPIYMVGAATGGWDWNHEVEMRSTAPGVYFTVAYFLNNETFRFFKQQDWGPTSYNYPYFDGGFVTDSLSNADDGDKNFKVLAPTGYYAVTVKVNSKVVDFDAVPEPKMFMTGAALGGWDWSTNFVQMTWKSYGIFEAETEFINGETFRFFAQQDWGPTSYNYPYYTTVDPLFENAQDGDKNFRFKGTTGVYKITMNMLDLTVTMAPVPGK
jgi:hypothetical protein